MDKEEFIERANKRHCGKYDYSKVEYINCKTKVCIICPEHGEFWQTPDNHYRGQGCPMCVGKKRWDTRGRLTTEDFIEKARKIHGDKYDYSKVTYVSARKKICIICPKHGEFWQTPDSHLNGNGCPECKKETLRTKKTTSFNDFLFSATTVHNGKYIYDENSYTGSKYKTRIYCPKHGEFWQNAYAHLKGCECPKCAKHYMDKETFIEISNLVHNNMYDYSLVDYKNEKTPVKIICKKHGVFEQKPDKHMRGHGCPFCSMSRMEKDVIRILTEKGIEYEYQKKFDFLGQLSLDFYIPFYKIGIECQGEQHYFPVDFAGEGEEWAQKSFQQILERDKRKRKLCLENDIDVEYISYEDNIEDKLGLILEKHGDN